MDKNSIKKFWDNQGKKTYLSNEAISSLEEDPILSNLRIQTEISKIMPMIEERVNSKSSILDLGGGAGQWALRFSSLVQEVSLVEFSDTMINLAIQSAANKKVNNIISQVIWFVGGSSVNWKIQHNVLHHSFTNVEHLDEDLESIPILRFSPHQKHMKIQKYQYIYAWFFYSLMTLMWATMKDFNQLNRFKRKDLIKTQKKSYGVLLAELVFVKAMYYVLFLVLPIIFLPNAWWLTVIFFICMHFIAGLSLAAIFQPAHVMPDTQFPLPDDQGNMENKWAIHQLMTTVNFAPESKFFSWYVGGLNFQVEHHLFPNICHIHYKKISEIVKKTAEEFNLPYYSKPTFAAALRDHTRFLKALGKPDVSLS